jgi:hypothetical protein
MLEHNAKTSLSPRNSAADRHAVRPAVLPAGAPTGLLLGDQLLLLMCP